MLRFQTPDVPVVRGPAGALLLSLALAVVVACEGESTAPEEPRPTASATSTTGSSSASSGGGEGDGGGGAGATSSGVAAGGGAGGDDGAGGSGAGGGGGGAEDPWGWNPCDALTAPGSPGARVLWREEGRTVIDDIGGVALDFAFPYAVVVPAFGSGQYRLEIELCQTRAAEPRECHTSLLRVPDGCAVEAIRWGLDASQCLPGDNLFELNLRLERGVVLVSESKKSFLAHHAP
jgi:hypothetical protein